MPRHRKVDVVIIERVADRAIDQCGRQGRQTLCMADQARLRSAAGFGQLVEQDCDERVVGAGERDAVVVEHALPGQRVHVVRQGVI